MGNIKDMVNVLLGQIYINNSKGKAIQGLL